MIPERKESVGIDVSILGMQNSLKEAFKNLGVSELQGRVYCAALELGEASLQALARKSGVKRTTIYSFLEALKQRGLLLETKKRRRSVYSALDPRKLLSLEQHRVREFEAELPALLAIANASAQKPRVTFYEGRGGIYEVYLDTLKEKQPILALTDYDPILEVMGQKFVDEYPIERSRRNITFRCITRPTKLARELERKNIGALREMKFLESANFETEVNIYGNKVALMSFRSSPPFAVLIEDRGIAQTLRMCWEELWKRL